MYLGAVFRPSHSDPLFPRHELEDDVFVFGVEVLRHAHVHLEVAAAALAAAAAAAALGAPVALLLLLLLLPVGILRRVYVRGFVFGSEVSGTLGEF